MRATTTRTIRVRAAGQNGPVEADVLGVGLHPLDAALVLLARVPKATDGTPTDLALRQRSDGTWVTSVLSPGERDFLATAGPGAGRKVTGRWWQAADPSEVPDALVYRAWAGPVTI